MNFEPKITRKTNLLENDSLSAYNGFTSQQNHNVYEIFFNFLSEVKPKQILEVGTALGGFTQFLSYSCKVLNLNTKIISLDIHNHDWYNDIREMGVEVNIENIFINDYSCITEKYSNFIKQDGLTIILCDGGNKIKEFDVLSNYMKYGDIIMAHDYAFDREYFENFINKKIWNWLEITESDIEDACKRNNLIDYKRDTFTSAVWIAKIKTDE